MSEKVTPLTVRIPKRAIKPAPVNRAPVSVPAPVNGRPVTVLVYSTTTPKERS